MTHPWRVEMFGGLRARSASSPDQPVTRFRTQKTAALLAYLALKPGPQPREVLCGLLWPDSPPEAARNSLSASLSSLRRQFEEGQSTDVIVADRLSVGLNPQSFTSDVAEFSQAQKRADAAPDDAARIEALSQAVEIYGGPLLPGFYDEWAVAEARCREEEFIAATSDLLDLLEDAGAWERAAAAARRGLGLQPDQEAWHLSVVRAHLALGRAGAALRQFDELKQFLERSGGTPSPRAQKLAAQAREQAQQAQAAPQVLAPISTPAAAPQVLAPPQPAPGSAQVLEAPQVLQAPAPPKPLGARLPTTLTRFFGRRLEITQIHRLLREDGERLVTLSGPGGSGKTRLALEAVRPLLGEWSETVAFVPLADLTDATFIFTAIRDALRLPAAPNLSPLEQVVEALGEAPALLLLDNFEQLVEDGAPLVQELLERLPLLSILVTSRQVLGLPGEREYPVAPLPVPGEDASPERLRECSGTALFIDRAQAARVDFRVDERNARAVASICRRLDGIPLALELAAARSLVLSPAQMLEKLRSSSDLLSTRQRGVPERHRTLRAAIAWSYGLLSGELQQFFARLSVFRGGWTFEAAEEVCGEPEALDFLSRLRECSLIVTEERAGETRFRMLETLREYALEQLEAGERAAGEAAYCKYFVALAEESEPHLRGPEQAVYLERLEGEQDNFRAVLAWAMEHDASAALRLAAALAPFWETRGHYAEGRAWIEQALARTSALPASAPPPNTSPSQPSSSPTSSGAAEEGESALSQARALHLAGRFAWFEGDMGAAAARLEESLALFRAGGDTEGALEATSSLIMTRAWQGDERAAVALVHEGMELRERIADRAAAVPTLAAFACAIVFVASESVVPQARDVSEETLALARAAGDKKSEGVAQACLGGCFHWEGKWQDAVAPHRASLAPLADIGEGWMAGYALWGLARAELALGHVEEARRCTEKSLRLQEGHRSPLGQPFCLDSCAMIAFTQGRLERSARLFGAAESNRECFGIALMPLMAARNLPYQQALRETLGPAAFDALWQEGRALNTAEARALGLEENAENEEDAAPQVQVLAEGAERPAEAAGELAKARALCSAGRLAWFGGDFSTARARLEEGLALLRAAGDVPGVVSAMSSLMMVLSWQGEEERALSLVRESCELAGLVRDRAGLLPVLGALGHALHTLSSARAQGEVRAVNEEVVLLARAAGDARALAVAQACLAQHAYWAGDFERARALFEASIAPLRELGDAYMESHSLWGLGRVAIAQGSLDEAERLSRGAIELRQGHTSLIGLPYMIESFALLAAARGQGERAVRLFASAAGIRDRQNCFAQSLVVAENSKHLQSLRESLGANAFAVVWEHGRALATEDAFALALEAPQVLASTVGAPRPMVWEGAGETPTLARARALCSAGRLAWFEGDFPTARARLEEGLALLRGSGNAPDALGAMSSLIMVLSWQGEEEEAVSLVRQGVQVLEGIADRAALLPLLSAFGWATFFCASDSVQDDSRRVNEEVARLARAAGDKRSLGVALACLGGHFYWRGRWDEARAANEESIPLLREVGDSLMVPFALWGLGRVAVREGLLDEALPLMQESLRLQLGANSPIGLPYTIEGFAQIVAASNPAHAVTLFAGASRMREAQQARPQSLPVAEISKYLQQTRAALGDEAFEAAWKRGRAMTGEQACDFALETAPDSHQPPQL